MNDEEDKNINHASNNEASDTVQPSHARPPRTAVVKNKAPAPIQITAEQLLREAWDNKEATPSASVLPKLRIADAEELAEYQREERKTFEQRIVRNRSHVGLWIKYARWEEEQRDFVRTRSVWERAIDNDYRNPLIWIQYAEFEMRHRFINHARNIFDRAIHLLPRCNDLWLRYTHMEEILKRKDLTRNIFQRWLKWYPPPLAYFAFIRFESRDNGIAKDQQLYNVRAIYNQLVSNFPTVDMYLKYARYEESGDNLAHARKVFEMVSRDLPSSSLSSKYFVAFAKFEVRRKQIERSRAIYKYALNHFTTANEQGEVDVINKAYKDFEKQYGSIGELDVILVNNKRKRYEQQLTENPNDYETWYELIQLEEENESQLNNKEKIKNLYERAISNVPSENTKPAWSTYIYLWLLYASSMELRDDYDVDKHKDEVIDIYKRCIAAVPFQHKKFSFGKLWVQYAHTEIRNNNLVAARRVFGTALGILPSKHKIYHEYIQMEVAIGDIERAREVYNVWLTRHPTYLRAFVLLSELEQKLGENERALSVLQLATKIHYFNNHDEDGDAMDVDDDEQGGDDPVSIDDIWSRVAKLVASTFNRDEAVGYFEQYIQDDDDDSDEGSSHAQRQYHTWTAYIEMMMELDDQDDRAIRAVFDRAYAALDRQARLSNAVHEYAAKARLLDMAEAWLTWETSRQDDDADSEHIDAVKRKMPTRTTVNGEHVIRLPDPVVDEGEDASTSKVLLGNKLLAAARQWKLGTEDG